MWSTHSNIPLFSSLSAVFVVLIMEATVLSLSAPVLLGQAELQLPLADGKAERGALLVTVSWWDRLPPHSPPRREAAPARRGATNGVAATAKPSTVPPRPAQWSYAMFAAYHPQESLLFAGLYDGHGGGACAAAVADASSPSSLHAHLARCTAALGRGEVGAALTEAFVPPPAES